MVTLVEYKTKLENEILELVSNWRPVKRHILYKYLHYDGCRIEGIDHKIEQALRAEVKEQNNTIG